MNNPIQEDRAVRPLWVCMEEGAVEPAGADEWGEYARALRERVHIIQEAEPAGDDRAAEPAYDEELELSDEEEAENGNRKTKRMLDPMLPSAAEVKEHQLTHLPYRNWCPHCVRGRGKEMNHEQKKADEDQGIPEYHMDYCFPGDENGQRMTILVVVERHTKMKKAVVVPSKGSTGRYAARKVLDLINECGDKDRPVILKTDQEPAIKFLVDDVCMTRTGAKTIVEQVPVRSKGSNGVVERAVQTVEQYIRTLKSQLDERHGVKVDTKHPVLTWLCEYSMYH